MSNPFTVLIVLSIWLLLSSSLNTSSEKALIRTLLDRYRQNGVIGRPVNHSKVQMWVQYGLQLIQILGLDENKQLLRTNCWTVYRWNDPLLRWKHTDYEGIRAIRILPHQIWTPDIKLHNFADERLQESRESGLVVYDDGNILWSQQALFKSTCQVEITYFPFDTQVCMLEFGSLTYDRELLELEWWTPDNSEAPMPYVDFTDYIPANDWFADGEEEKDIPHERRTKQIRSVKRYRLQYTTTDQGKQKKHFPILRFLIRLHRNPSFHMFILVVPCILLSFMTLVVFWLPPDSAAKLMLGINIFVAFFVLLLLLSESMPRAVRNFPLIGIFFLLNMVMVTLSTFLSTMVVNLFHRGADGRFPPLWVRRVFIDGLGNALHLRQNIPLPKRTHDSAFNDPGELISFTNSDPGNKLSFERKVHTRNLRICEPLSCDTDQIKEHLKSLDWRQTKQHVNELSAMEWRTLALIIDRIFFILYLLIMAAVLIIVVWNTEVIDMSRILLERDVVNGSE